MGRQYSRRELIAEAVKRGWTIDERRGKGSHAMALKEGERPFPIPRKISPGVHDMIKKRLGIKN